MIGCEGKWDLDAGTCTDDIRARNDALAPLWAAGSALMPSIYARCEYNGTGSPPHCADGSDIGAKNAVTLGEAARVNAGHRMPILPFTWYTLYNSNCANKLGHCPLMRDPLDLRNEFAAAKGAEGVAGLIVWGSHGDVRAGTSDCTDFAAYLESTLGPELATLS